MRPKFDEALRSGTPHEPEDEWNMADPVLERDEPFRASKILVAQVERFDDGRNFRNARSVSTLFAAADSGAIIRVPSIELS